MLESYNYGISILIMMVGLAGVITRGNLVKKMISLAIFQVSVLLFYISIGYVEGGAVPIITQGVKIYANPVPHVLMLTAIVVGVAVMAVGLSLIVRIKEEYGTIEEDEILQIDNNSNSSEGKSS